MKCVNVKKSLLAMMFAGILLAGTLSSCGEVSKSENNASSSNVESSSQISEDSPTESSSEEPEMVFDEEEVLSQIEVTEQECDKTSNRGKNIYAAIYKNNSNFNIELAVHCEFLDESGERINYYTEAIKNFAPNTEGAIAIYVGQEYKDVEVTLFATEVKGVVSLTKNLTASLKSNPDEKMEVEITNNGEELANRVAFGILYYKNGKVVNMDFNNIGSNVNIGDIEPGETKTVQVNYFDDYDDARIFVSAYGYID